MSYNPTNWQNLPSTTSPVIASSLNNMETGIDENDNAIGKETYDNTQTYDVGEYCIYNNTLYRCKTAITTAESFDSSKWTSTSILNEIDRNNKVIGGDAYDSTATYKVGEYCIYNNTLYQCNTKIATAEPFNSSHWTAVSVVSKLKEVYSANEQIVGNWMSGEPLYMKVVDIGYFPNNSTKTVSLGLPSDAFIVKAESYFFVGTTFATLPYIVTDANFSTYTIDLTIDNGNVSVTTYRDRRNAYGRTIIYYIKTND